MMWGDTLSGQGLQEAYGRF